MDHVGHLERLTMLGLHALVSILREGHARGSSSCRSLHVLGRSVLEGSLVRHLVRLLSSGSSSASLLGGVGASLLDGVLLGRVDAEEPVGGVRAGDGPLNEDPLWVTAADASLRCLLVSLLAGGAAPLVLGIEVLDGSKRLAIALLEDGVNG